MTRSIDYFFGPQSPWTYLGHDRLLRIAQAHGAVVRARPVDLGRVFAASGGLPLQQRPAQRQSYRLVELRRHADFLGLQLNLQPRFFPVAGHAAARLIIAAGSALGDEAALRLAGAALTAVWAEERDIADATTLAALVAGCGLPARLLDDAQGEAAGAAYEAHTAAAIEAGVFGAPTYRLGGELFWGQDRLDFLDRQLARGA